MNSGLYGFLIDGDIQFNIAKRKLLHYGDDDSERSFFFQSVSLNETQARLLIYLLKSRQNAVIYKNDIMKHVWDEFSLPSSNQRLWQTINELRKKLSSIGLPGDFIANVHGAGYFIDPKRVMSLLVK